MFQKSTSHLFLSSDKETSNIPNGMGRVFTFLVKAYDYDQHRNRISRDMKVAAEKKHYRDAVHCLP